MATPAPWIPLSAMQPNAGTSYGTLTTFEWDNDEIEAAMVQFTNIFGSGTRPDPGWRDDHLCHADLLRHR